MSRVHSAQAFHQLWSVSKYRFLGALRPFSLVVASMSSSLGLALGWSAASSPWLLAALTLAASLLLQAGVNLINDYGDRELVAERYGHLTPEQQHKISRSIALNFNYGLVAIVLGVLLGLILVFLSGPLLIWIGVIGVIGVFSYAQPPLDFKRRGLGAVAVFFLMGVLMVQGAYYVMAGTLSWQVLWLSLPISTLVSLLLLANELRDYHLDQQEGQRTLAVRLGFMPVCHLYRFLMALAFLLPLLFFLLGWGWPQLLPWLALPLALRPLQLLKADAQARLALPPLTGRLMAGFGVLQLIGWLLIGGQ